MNYLIRYVWVDEWWMCANERCFSRDSNDALLERTFLHIQYFSLAKGFAIYNSNWCWILIVQFSESSTQYFELVWFTEMSPDVTIKMAYHLARKKFFFFLWPHALILCYQHDICLTIYINFQQKHVIFFTRTALFSDASSVDICTWKERRNIDYNSPVHGRKERRVSIKIYKICIKKYWMEWKIISQCSWIGKIHTYINMY